MKRRHGWFADANQTLRANEGLVWDCARRFEKFKHGDTDDLLQEGRIGLWIAWQRFDRARGLAFSTYAYKWIFQRMVRFVQLDRVVHVPANQVDALRRADPDHQTDPYQDAAMNALATMLNLDFDNDDGRPGIRIAASDDPHRDLETEELWATIDRELAALPNHRMRVVMRGRYGRDTKRRTLKSLARELGISKQGVGQLEARALTLLARKPAMRRAAGLLP